MKYIDGKPYYSLSNYYKSLFGEKIYKVSLNAHLTCPNRDGLIDTKGCIFCSEGGSGDFAGNPFVSIRDQIESGKEQLKNKAGSKFIAYFQAYTNTYGDINYLRKIYYEAIHHESIVGIAIATRPDCLGDEVIKLLDEINRIKPVWIELGLQTIHEKSAQYINRGYPLSTFDSAVEKLNAIHINIVVHLILGLPSESKSDILESVQYIAKKKIHGVKLHLLHVLKNTALANDYLDGTFQVYEMDEYINLLIDCIEVLPQDIVIHRMTGDGPKNLLLAPKWSGNKKHVLNQIHKRFKQRETFQGRLIEQED